MWTDVPLASAYYRAEVDPDLDVIRVTRTAAEYPEPAAVLADMQAVYQLAVMRPERRLLVDLRGSPRPRADSTIEDAGAGPRRQLNQHFERVALVVRTAVGRLQIQRLLKADGVDGMVTFDEAEALRFLTAPGA